MVDIFKSAFDAFGSRFNSAPKSDFTGQIVDVGTIRLRIGNQIAEGGYALVFLAYDIKTNKEYALKRLFAADDAANKVIAQEIAFLQKLKGHPNIVGYVAAASNQDTTLRRTEYLLLTEYCSGGRLYERTVNRQKPFDPEQVIQIFYQIARAVQHMHQQSPPIIHRDLKVENCLISASGFIQLCDFGSATTKTYQPDETWSTKKREYVEDEMTKVTTPMYRAPEMLDTYSNYPINEQVDIWALGCLLYYICYIQHPFEDSAKLRILNAKYTIPATDTKYIVLHDLIKMMLQIDPRQRPTIQQLVESIEDLAIGNDIGLNEPLKFLFIMTNESVSATSQALPQHYSSNSFASNVFSSSAVINSSPSSVSSNQKTTSSPPSASSIQTQAPNQLLSSLKGTGKSWMKNLLDTSSKVITDVKQSLATNAQTTRAGGQFEVDLSYITSRLIVMATPRETVDLAGKQSVELIRDFLDTKHQENYRLYSVEKRRVSYRKEVFHDRVVEYTCFDDKLSPKLSDLIKFCYHVTNYLLEFQSNVVVLHCADGRNQSALCSCALLAYHGVFSTVDQCVRYFETKRCAHPMLSYSQKRYIQYFCDLSHGIIERPHLLDINLKTINLSPVPTFNRERNGCRPYVDIYNTEQKKIFSTYQDPSRIRLFSTTDGVCLLPIGFTFNGDISIHISHAPVGISLSAHDGGIRICELSLNSNFCSSNHAELSYSRYELDGCDATEKYPPSFRVSLDTLGVKKQQQTEQQDQQLQEYLGTTYKKPNCLFQDRNEYQQTIDDYGDSHPAHIPNDESTSQVIYRSPKLNINEEPSSPHSNKGSPTITQQVRASVSPQSPGSFVNPRHSAQPSTPSEISGSSGIAQRPKSAQIHSSTMTNPFQTMNTIEQKPLFEPAVGTLLDFDQPASQPLPSSVENETISPSIFPAAELVESQHKQDIFERSVSSTVSESTTSDDGFDIFTLSTSSTTSLPPIQSEQVQNELLGFDFSGFSGSGEKLSTPNTPTNQRRNINRVPSPMNVPFASASLQQPTLSRNASSTNSFSTLRTTQETANQQQRSSSNQQINLDIYDPFAFLNITQSQAKTASQDNMFSQQQQQQTKPQMTTGITTAKSQQPPTPVSAEIRGPNYNINMTNTSAHQNVNKSSAPPSRPQQSTNIDDLVKGLGGKDFGAKSTVASIKELRNVDLTKNIDPTVLRVREWTEGKKKNIRALLCSLKDVVWEDCKWQGCQMHELLTPDQVKKVYRKAVIYIHPDKLQDDPNKDLARMIFVELNEAWAQFEQEGQKSLLS
ncbi:unnamed protein product [Didymodactylos carnosus]|uniref:Cyclin-G-associated kinase n=1 Tax=Didymodactylos carnosus TaxID=1234261 RepID=A0A814F403_9BILA|nr:unnamed protein product [Didymodactylos carnosus]CAF0976298.1 unnamed protein product [Didymodactylos carnosus]CAF3584434.1 unnamed protein product [Didymodactylos carnosus]CAF3749158.1 unnamed protein product [Didymodactylos carnosus]